MKNKGESIQQVPISVVALSPSLQRLRRDSLRGSLSQVPWHVLQLGSALSEILRFLALDLANGLRCHQMRTKHSLKETTMHHQAKIRLFDKPCT
eukprot:5291344-Amphidinium_carterae.1